MTIARTLPFFEKKILPKVKRGGTILISAHGNSIRGMIMEMEGLSKEAVVSLEIETGKPLFYSYDNGWKRG